jgi:hypothetical protein
MTKNFIETLLFSTLAINAALLFFIADILKKMLHSIDKVTAKNLITSMVRFSSKSVFMILMLNLPFLLAIPYYWCYGFGNTWITAGLALWMVAGSLSKVYKIPVYKRLAALDVSATDDTANQHRKFDQGNLFQAILYAAAAVLSGIGLL